MARAGAHVREAELFEKRADMRTAVEKSATVAAG